MGTDTGEGNVGSGVGGKLGGADNGRLMGSDVCSVFQWYNSRDDEL